MNTGRPNSLIHRCRLMIVILIALAVGMQTTYAQQKLSGSIISTKDNSPVAGAFVYAYADQTMTGYALSDGDGLFTISLSSGKTANKITVTCLGYKTESITLSGKNPPYKITLTESHVTIKESKVTASVVEEKGDTLSYSAGAFANGTERNLGDLLEKIPGISVTQSGGILYNGSYINKFYVEGMDLMGSQYGVVTKNLSPDKIAKVEVLRRHQPIRALIGIQQSGKSAVNIVLKEDARNTWMVTGDFLGGAPKFLLFDAKAMMTRFSKKSQDLYLVKGNDIGGDILKELTMQRYMGRTGAFLLSDESLDADFIGRLNPRRAVLPLPQEYWYDNLSGIASFNHLSRIDTTKQLRISMQGAAERYEESTQSSEMVSFADGTSMTINETDGMTDTKYYLSGKIAYENNSTRKYVRNETTFSGQIRDNDGSVIGDTRNYGQRYDMPSFKAENNLEITLKTSNRHALSLSSLTRFWSNSHSADFTTDFYEAHQDLSTSSLVSDNSISSSFVKRGVKTSISAGLNLKYNGIDSKLEGLEDVSARTEASVGLFNATPSLSVESSFLLGRTETRISVPVSLNILGGNGIDRTIAAPLFSPSLSLSRNLSRNLKATGYASYSLSRSDIETLLPSAVMSSYRSLAYSDSLAKRQSSNARLSLNWSDNVDMIYAGVSAQYSWSGSDRMATNVYSENFTITGFKDAWTQSKDYGLSGNVSKYFGSRTFMIGADGGWTRMDQDLSLQGHVGSYTTERWNCSLTTRTSPADWISLEAKAEFAKDDISGSTSSSSKELKATGMVAIMPCKPLSVITNIDWLHESVSGMSITNTPLVKTSATWKFKKFSIVAQCRNILGCKSYTREYVTAFQTFSTTTNLRGRQFLVGIRMSL